jgi:hypothetical protein
MEPFELLEKLFELENKFATDPEVMKMKKKLKDKLNSLEKEVFTQDELVSSELEEAHEQYYEHQREMDLDDYDLFQVVYFA